MNIALDKIKKIKVPEKVEKLIEKLIENNYEAYAVGGCVRDTLLNKIPDDWDITTSATPKEVKSIFRRTIDTGIVHGTVTVMLGDEGFEVTTYRIDGEYADSRHPKEVEFTSNLVEDLKRRDFTINAMAYNNKDGIIDEFDGIGDMERKLIKCVGKAEERFDEDALRILRAVRFSAQLGFEIEENTKNAIRKKIDGLKNISAERIRVELSKILLSDRPDKLVEAMELGITKIVLKEFDEMMKEEQNNPHHIYSVGMHTIKSIEEVNKICREQNIDKKEQLILCFTMLLHDVGKIKCKVKDEKGIDHFKGHAEIGSDMAKNILRDLKFDNQTVNIACRIIKCHDDEFRMTPYGMRKALNRIGGDIIKLLFIVKEADIKAQSPEYMEEKLIKLNEIISLYNTVKNAGDAITLKELEINGEDLIKVGFKSGKDLGNILNKLLEKVLENPECNKKEKLLYLAKEMQKSI